MADLALYATARLREIEARHRGEPLMARAGQAAADWAGELAADRNDPVLILAGPGNNGGDAFVVARRLRERFFDVDVVFSGPAERLPAEARDAHAAWRAAGGTTVPDVPERDRWGLIVDGLFGIGLTRAPEGRHADWIRAANRLAGRDGCPVLALDCPSGLDAETGQVFVPAIMASHTLTFIASKPGLWTADGPDHCGELRVAPLGIVLDDDVDADGWRITTEDFIGRLKPRRRNTHKGSFGGAGILGGNRSMTGAALLAGRAALKMGTGRVYVGLLDPEPPSVDLVQPELMLHRADALLQMELQALACGPGLGRSGEAIRLLEQALKCPLPVVLDADALNILASDGRLEGNLYNRVAPAILTPHPAEAARLLGVAVRDIQADRVASARALARRYGCHVALKGCGTVVATIDGQYWINGTGNPGMASAGMGDVLTGIVVALLAQNWRAEEALLAAVHLHGAAADRLAAEGCGPVGLTACEVIDAARRVFNEWVGRGRAC